MSLKDPSPIYKPFRYPWAFEAWQLQQRLHWIPEEVSMAEDVRDWQTKLTKEEKNLLSQIFRFFTLSDMMVNDAYINHYMKVFKTNEILMMFSAFANQESIHQAAYAYLVDTLGLPDSEYSAFLKYKEMTDKYDYMQSFTIDNDHEIAKTMAAFAAFTEGLQLFASFAILLNFPRFNKMKGMGQIISWSVRDECYVEGTEILTPKGWKGFNELTEEDKVAQFSEDGSIEFVFPSRLVSYDVDGKVVDFSSKKNSLNFCVTENHDILYKNKYNNKWTKTKAEEFKPHYRRQIPISGRIQGGEKLHLTPLDRVRIAFAADGSLPDSRHTGSRCGYLRVHMSLTKPRKIERAHKILKDANSTYSAILEKDGGTLFRFNAPVDISKRLSNWVHLDEISASWCDEFIDELKHWDGNDRYNDDSYIVYGTVIPEERDLVQAICAISGRICTVITSIDPRGYKIYYRLAIRKLSLQSTGTLQKKSIPYKGKIYCVTVPSGAVVIRYKGDVCISGNSVHVHSVMKLFHEFLTENPNLWTKRLKEDIKEICQQIVKHEDAFIDLAFSLGGVQGLAADELKHYIRYIADRRLIELGIKGIYKVKKNPLPWLENMLNAVELTNFFENRATEYSKASTQGTWEEVYSEIDKKRSLLIEN